MKAVTIIIESVCNGAFCSDFPCFCQVSTRMASSSVTQAVPSLGGRGSLHCFVLLSWGRQLPRRTSCCDVPSCGAFNILRHLSLSSIRFVANASIPHLQFYSGQWSGSQTSGLALAGCKSVSPDCTLTQSQSTADLFAFSNQKSEAGACSNKISHLSMNRTSSF